VAGETEEAALRYRAALEADPRQRDALAGLANLLASSGKLDEAIVLYRRVTDLSPNQPFARYNLGLALETRGDRAGAIEQYRAVLELVPDPSKLESELQASLFRGGGFGTLLEKTRARLAALLGEAPPQAPPAASGADALVQEGNALADRGRMDEAVVRYEKALALDPRNPLAHYNLALAREAAGDAVAAERHYVAAISVAPTFANAHNNLAVLLFRRGDYAGAWREARLARSHGLAPNEEFLRALAERMPEPRD
jgi:Flp pilus assembly protein TadD